MQKNFDAAVNVAISQENPTRSVIVASKRNGEANSAGLYPAESNQRQDQLCGFENLGNALRKSAITHGRFVRGAANRTIAREPAVPRYHAVSSGSAGRPIRLAAGRATTQWVDAESAHIWLKTPAGGAAHDRRPGRQLVIDRTLCGLGVTIFMVTVSESWTSKPSELHRDSVRSEKGPPFEEVISIPKGSTRNFVVVMTADTIHKRTI